MPRTIESLIDCQRMTQERRSQGLSGWARSIEIKRFLTDAEDDASVIRIGRDIARTIRLSRWSAEDSEVAELAEFFDEIEFDWIGHYRAPVDRLNALLDDLYDLADYARVWVG